LKNLQIYIQWCCGRDLSKNMSRPVEKLEICYVVRIVVVKHTCIHELESYFSSLFAGQCQTSLNKNIYRWNIGVSLRFPNIHWQFNMTSYIIYVRKNCVCLKNAAIYYGSSLVHCYCSYWVQVIYYFSLWLSVKSTSPLPQIFQYNTCYALQQTSHSPRALHASWSHVVTCLPSNI
jgi:hypothetical protein